MRSRFKAGTSASACRHKSYKERSNASIVTITAAVLDTLTVCSLVNSKVFKGQSRQREHSPLGTFTIYIQYYIVYTLLPNVVTRLKCLLLFFFSGLSGKLSSCLSMPYMHQRVLTYKNYHHLRMYHHIYMGEVNEAGTTASLCFVRSPQ